MAENNQGISPSDLMDARAMADNLGIDYEHIGFHWDVTNDRWELWHIPAEAVAAGASMVGFFCTATGCWREP
jgi:hypothetical protein